jgi:hypothetical protein
VKVSNFAIPFDTMKLYVFSEFVLRNRRPKAAKRGTSCAAF